MGNTLSITQYKSFTLMAIAAIFAYTMVNLGTKVLRMYSRFYERGPTHPEAVEMGRLESEQNGRNA